jgi:hypothetical protein
MAHGIVERQVEHDRVVYASASLLPTEESGGRRRVCLFRLKGCFSAAITGQPRPFAFVVTQAVDCIPPQPGEGQGQIQTK